MAICDARFTDLRVARIFGWERCAGDLGFGAGIVVVRAARRLIQSGTSAPDVRHVFETEEDLERVTPTGGSDVLFAGRDSWEQGYQSDVNCRHLQFPRELVALSSVEVAGMAVRPPTVESSGLRLLTGYLEQLHGMVAEMSFQQRRCVALLPEDQQHPDAGSRRSAAGSCPASYGAGVPSAGTA